MKRTAKNRPTAPRMTPIAARRARFREDHAQDAASRRAERRADADLGRALRDVRRQHAVESERAQEQRDDAEERAQEGDGALAAERRFHLLAQRHEPTSGTVGAISRSASRYAEIAAAFVARIQQEHEVAVAQIGRQREIDRPRRRFAQAAELRVLGDADDAADDGRGARCGRRCRRARCRGRRCPTSARTGRAPTVRGRAPAPRLRSARTRRAAARASRTPVHPESSSSSSGSSRRRRD